jgi:hypothetical protein
VWDEVNPVTNRWLSQGALLGSSLLLGALLAPAVAAAQPAVPAPRAWDGRSLDIEPAATQSAFQAAYGAEAGARWRLEHDVATRTDLAQAVDGMTLQSQANDTRVAFVVGYGDPAAAKWALAHTGALGRALILTGDLDATVKAVEAGNIPGAQAVFKRFSTDWENDFETLVRPRSDEIANTIAAQIHAVSVVLVTPASPDRTKVLDELQELSNVIREQQAKLAALPAGSAVVIAPPVAAVAAAPATPGAQKLSITIDTGELESSITGGNLNNLVRAKGELEEFGEAWDEVKTAVQRENATAYNEIVADLEAARAVLLSKTGPAPEPAVYLPLLQKALATIKKYQ